MKRDDAPRLERRRAADFERELLARARTWMPSWSLDETQADFGLALLRIAARFNSEVAERLDRAGEKMALGFLDWLGLRAAAARPARMPVVMKLAETAREPILATRPAKMQVDVEDSTVTFETETDVMVVPGQLAAVVAVDPVNDAYFLPPPGLTSLDPIEPLPKAWKLKNFAAANSKMLQLDPGLGLAEGMLVEIAGEQYAIVKAKDDLAEIDPPVPPGDGFDEGTRVAKVETFRPFDGARNLQEHILYIGDADALNVEAAARIEVGGLGAVPEEVKWEYYGKSESEDPAEAEARWREISVEETPPPTPEALVLNKLKGSIETTDDDGLPESRWIRARLKTSSNMIESDGVALRINPRANTNALPPALNDPLLRSQLPPVEIIVNTTPSSSSNFYLFGQEPRLFDTLYIGSQEAFSKPGSTTWIMFDLSDGAFDAMTAFNRGSGAAVLAGVDSGGGLHLFTVGPTGGLSKLNEREAPQPSPEDVSDAAATSPSNFVLTSRAFRPPVWQEGSTLSVAVAAVGDVWVRKEWPATSVTTSGLGLGFITIPGLSIPIPGGGLWEYWGAPSGGSDDEVIGMAVVNDGAGAALVAQTKTGVFKRATAANAPWQPLTIDNIPTAELVSIVGMRSEDPPQLPQQFLAIRRRSNGTCALHRVSGSGAGSDVFGSAVDVNPAVVPLGITFAGTTVVVAGEENPSRLRAWRSDNVSSQVDFDGSSLANTILDGSSQLAGPTVYARGEVNGAAALLVWTPFDADPEDTLFATLIDIFPEAPRGPIASVASSVFLPGNRKGEVFSAVVSAPTKLQANASDFVSAFEPTGTAQALDVDDKVVFRTGTLTAPELEAAKIVAQPFEATSDFYELDKRIPRDTQEDDVFIVENSVQPKDGTVGAAHGSWSEFTPAAGTLVIGEVLLVKESAAANADEQPVEVVADLGTGAFRVEPELIAPPGTIKYRESAERSGRVHPSLKLGANNDWDIARIAASGIYFPDLDPERQAIIALRKAVADPTKADFLVLGQPWGAAVPAAGQIDFLVADVSSWTQVRSAKVANATLAWEYWNGTGWWILDKARDKLRDETSDLRTSGTVSFLVPADIKPGEWAGKTNYWVRARIIGGNYGEAKVRLITEQDGSQTVDRNTDDLQPPFAVNVRVAYALDKAVVPKLVLTRDSGALRDQSDANKTAGANVEIFTPLAVTLGKFDAPRTAIPVSNNCLPDCECPNGTASMSPAPTKLAVASAAGLPGAGAGRRGLYLGFTAKLLGGPVKVLFVVGREDGYDEIAPLNVDALIGDRFTSIVAADGTRALGESGVLTMTFDVEPLQADLFGQALSWLRLTPQAESTDWKPSLAGVYPNGVWARAAETMTRELLGSSEGQPLLTLTLARPPLLENSLELRVREPLGEEELVALNEKDPDLVRSDVEDLPGHWILWKQVHDPLDCDPADRVYSLDEGTGTVKFGDGRHGAIPPVGIDSIVAFAYERTEPAIAGVVAANLVEPRTEINLVSPIESVETVVAADRSAGGVAPETPARVLQFAPAKLRHRGRAVALSDFEDLARQKSADVVRARGFARNGRIRLVVVMRGPNPAPSRAQQRELRGALLEAASAALGVPGALTITGPGVRRLRVALDLRVATLDLAGRVAKESKDRLVKRFDSELGGDDGQGWALGREPRDADVAEALLDIENLQGIASIRLFEIDQLGTETAWSAPVKPDQIVRLEPEDVRVGFEVMEAAA